MLSPPSSGIPGRWACTGALRVGDPYFHGPSVLDSGWEQRWEDGVLTYSTQRNRLRRLLITFPVMVPALQRESIAPVVRMDANESLRHANDFPTKSCG